MASLIELIRRASGEVTPINDETPHGFLAEQYIYRRLGFNCESMTFVYDIIKKPIVEGDDGFGNIVQFARNILAGNPVQKDDDNPELKPLDITVSRHSYILLELPEGWSFTAAVGEHGVTLGNYPTTTANAAAYGELRYVTPTDLQPHPIPGCRMVFFKAINQAGSEEDPYLQPLNFSIFLRDGMAVVIDPDIRFPGNGGG